MSSCKSIHPSNDARAATDLCPLRYFSSFLIAGLGIEDYGTIIQVNMGLLLWNAFCSLAGVFVIDKIGTRKALSKFCYIDPRDAHDSQNIPSLWHSCHRRPLCYSFRPFVPCRPVPRRPQICHRCHRCCELISSGRVFQLVSLVVASKTM